ncbi:MAG TPA: amidohydrolase family protein [Acidimicrobiales bacterium]
MPEQPPPPRPRRPTGAQIARRRFLVFGGLGLATVAVGGTALKACSGGSGGSATESVTVTEPERIDPPTLEGSESPPPSDTVFDTVIAGGRVMDPATGYDQIANVGILGERIALISTDALTGESTIDATGKVVAPGFIDLLSYEPNPYGVWYKLGDGVTTNLGMHGIKTPVDASQFLAGYEGENAPPLHFGGAFSDQWYRDSIGIGASPSASQISRLTDDFNAQLDEGFIGIAIDPEYAPSIGTAEFEALGTAAQQAGMPLFTHIRYSSPQPAGQSSLDALDEVLAVARTTGVSLHVDHLPSMTTHVMPEAVERIETARGEGLDVTACFYPYTFWGTYLASNRFSGDWQSRFQITYSDLQLAGSSERLTESSFRKYQQQNKLVVAYAIPQDDVNAVASLPWSMVGSDAIPESANNNHPRGAGCFSRLLGPYVRDLQVLSLMDALAKCTIIPARQVEGRVPMMAKKGRMQMGADADITVFDPATIADTSTVEQPAQMSAGVSHVLVLGRVAKDPNGVDKDVRNGRPVVGEPA